MTFTAYVSYQAEDGAGWNSIPIARKPRKTHRGARADALATFAMFAPAHPRMFARIVKDAGEGTDHTRRVVETLEIPA